MKNPSRFTFDGAAEHVYTLLLKKDCYPRFIRSEHYKNLLANGVQPLAKRRYIYNDILNIIQFSPSFCTEESAGMILNKTAKNRQPIYYDLFVIRRWSIHRYTFPQKICADFIKRFVIFPRNIFFMI